MWRPAVCGASWALGALLVLPAPTRAQAADSPLPVSLARIRAALDKEPSRLQPAAPPAGTPTFRVAVEQYYSPERSVAEEPFDPTMGVPSLGELVVGGIGKIRSAAVGYTRSRARRKARREVAEALADFCAVHDCPKPTP